MRVMRVIIAGSRAIKGQLAYDLIEEAVDETGWRITEVVSGDAEGVDQVGVEWAKKNKLDYVIMPANWKLHGKRAGYLRNQKMAWYVRSASRILELQGKEVPDKWRCGLIAIWNGTSRGTAHMIDLAREMNLEVIVIHPPEGSVSSES